MRTPTETIVDLQERVLILEFVVGRLAQSVGMEVEFPTGYLESVKQELLPILERRKTKP